MSEGHRSKLVKGAAWMGSATVLVNIIGFFSTILLARLLMPADFGLIAIATAVLGIIGVITEFSLYMALVQHEDPEPSHFHTAWTMNVVRGAVVGLLIAMVATPISMMYDDPRLRDIIMVMGLMTLVGGFLNPKLAVFERELQFHQTFVMQLTGKVIGFVATIGIAWAYRSYWALVLGPLITQVCLVIVSYMLIPYRPRFTLSRHRDLLSYSIWVTLGNWVTALSWRIDPLVLGYFIPARMLGQYSMGDQLVSKAIGELMAPIKKVLFPAFSRIKDDAERLRKGYLRSQGVLCIIGFPVAVGIVVTAPELVVAALGEKWRMAVPVVQLVAVMRMVQIADNLNAVALATGHTKIMFNREMRAFLVRWPFMGIGMYLGRDNTYTLLIGALMGRLAATFINSWINMDLIRKITTITLRDHLLALWRPLAASGLMALAVFAVRPSLPFGTDFHGLVLRLAVMIPVGAIVYMGAMVAIWVLTGRRAGIETEAVSIASQFARGLLSRIRKRTA